MRAGLLPDSVVAHRRRVSHVDVDVTRLEGEPGEAGAVEAEGARWGGKPGKMYVHQKHDTAHKHTKNVSLY